MTLDKRDATIFAIGGLFGFLLLWNLQYIGRLQRIENTVNQIVAALTRPQQPQQARQQPQSQQTP